VRFVKVAEFNPDLLFARESMWALMEVQNDIDPAKQRRWLLEAADGEAADQTPRREIATVATPQLRRRHRAREPSRRGRRPRGTRRRRRSCRRGAPFAATARQRVVFGWIRSPRLLRRWRRAGGRGIGSDRGSTQRSPLRSPLGILFSAPLKSEHQIRWKEHWHGARAPS
jgi:hypothetical protein